MGLLRTRLQASAIPRPSIRQAFSRHATARTGKYGASPRRLARAIAMQGDPGLFSFIGGGLKKIGGMALGVGSMFLPGAVGKGLSLLQKVGPTVLGGAASGVAAAGITNMFGGGGGKRGSGKPGRRMNWANPRALGRAERRMGSFIKHFSKSARALGYQVHRGTRSSKRTSWPRKK
jgi:hypothetical protein